MNVRAAAAALVFLTGLASCAAAPRAQQAAIGFIFVGSTDDLGYNEASGLGADAVARQFPNVRVLREENVPETGAAIDAMERLIADGAGLIFATSFGYRDAAFEVARRHPSVIVIHQGGTEPEPRLPNFGTVWSSVYQAVYQAGIVAGATTRTNRLGFVGAFPIPPVISNINAFTLGARSVDPDVIVDVALTNSWCNPASQRTAAAQLIAANDDVLAQHQDCTRTILEAAKNAGIHSIGYHADGSEVGGSSWLIGTVWRWDDIYINVVRTWLSESFAGSQFDGDFRATFGGDLDPFILTEPGPDVSAQTREAVMDARARFNSGQSPFAGPIVDNTGVEQIAKGNSATQSDIESMDYFVEGVVLTDAS